MPFVKIRNTEMRYFNFGNGRRHFVIIPGVSMKPVSLSRDAVAKAYECFCDEYTVTVFDRITKPQDNYTVEDMAEDTAYAMKCLEIENADIFGCSQGGMMLQIMAVRHPKLVRKAILASTLSRPNEVSKKVIGSWAKMATDGDTADLNRDIYEKIYSPECAALYHDFFETNAADVTKEELKHFATVMNACAKFDFYENLDKIKCPVLVIGSKNDRVLSGNASVEIAEKLGCEIYMYNNYGHAVYDEAPDYKQKLLEFLRK